MWAGGARNLWSEQPLAPPAEDVISGLEFLVDLSMWSFVGEQDETKQKIELTPTVHGIMLPYSHFKTQVTEITYKLCTDEWQRHPTCRLSKNFLPFPCKRKRKDILKLSRSQIRRLLELITDQNNLNYVQSKIHPGTISELCRFCEEEDETFAHLLNECPCFLTDRRNIF